MGGGREGIRDGNGNGQEILPGWALGTLKIAATAITALAQVGTALKWHPVYFVPPPHPPAHVPVDAKLNLL